MAEAQAWLILLSDNLPEFTMGCLSDCWSNVPVMWDAPSERLVEETRLIRIAS
jgi:hypothetical protein